jgi:hypothetical protein
MRSHFFELAIDDHARREDFWQMTAETVDLFQLRVGFFEHAEFDVAVRGLQVLLIRRFERHYGSPAMTRDAVVLSLSRSLTFWTCVRRIEVGSILDVIKKCMEPNCRVVNASCEVEERILSFSRVLVRIASVGSWCHRSGGGRERYECKCADETNRSDDFIS